MTRADLIRYLVPLRIQQRRRLARWRRYRVVAKGWH